MPTKKKVKSLDDEFRWSEPVVDPETGQRMRFLYWPWKYAQACSRYINERAKEYNSNNLPRKR